MMSANPHKSSGAAHRAAETRRAAAAKRSKPQHEAGHLSRSSSSRAKLGAARSTSSVAPLPARTPNTRASAMLDLAGTLPSVPMPAIPDRRIAAPTPADDLGATASLDARKLRARARAEQFANAFEDTGEIELITQEVTSSEKTGEMDAAAIDTALAKKRTTKSEKESKKLQAEVIKAAKREERKAAKQAKKEAAQKARAAKPALTREQSDRRLKRVFGAVAGLLVAAYIGGTVYFSSHLFPNTSLNGEDASLISRDALVEKVNTARENYELEASYNNFTLKVAGNQIGLTGDGSAYASAVFEQVNPLAWPVEFNRNHELEAKAEIDYDQAALDQIVSDAVARYNETAAQPIAPEVRFDTDKVAFYVSEGETAEALETGVVSARVREGISEMVASVELDDSCLMPAPPAEDPDALAAGRDAADGYLDFEIPLTLDYEDRSVVEPKTIGTWIAFDENSNPYVSEDRVRAWAETECEAMFTFKDEWDTHHVWIDKITPTLMDRVYNHSSYAVEIPMWKERTIPDEFEGAAELGRHIAIDLDNQYVRLYDTDGSIIWESFCVSGTLDGEHGTPTGEYEILNKAMHVELVGFDEDHDGEPDYKTPVTYWMPFIGNAVGLHDAPWRYSFGGPTYYWSGSHGCVNLPYDKAEELYGIIEIGDKVIVRSLKAEQAAQEAESEAEGNTEGDISSEGAQG